MFLKKPTFPPPKRPWAGNNVENESNPPPLQQCCAKTSLVTTWKRHTSPRNAHRLRRSVAFTKKRQCFLNKNNNSIVLSKNKQPPCVPNATGEATVATQRVGRRGYFKKCVLCPSAARPAGEAYSSTPGGHIGESPQTNGGYPAFRSNRSSCKEYNEKTTRQQPAGSRWGGNKRRLRPTIHKRLSPFVAPQQSSY
jgi:hypothetical protein